jgi:hypothetical protein
VSGLYTVVHGKNKFADALVVMLQAIAPFETGRFRDAWVEMQGDAVIVRLHTRNGGGNRPDYVSQIESMRAHPWFWHDADMSYDTTYADFYFCVPPDDVYFKFLEMIAVEPVDMSAKWQEAIAALERGETNPAIEKLQQQLAEAVESGQSGVIYVGEP